jgi:predicted RNase H-like HicB family nuclease
MIVNVTSVQVEYHVEGGAWWADSPDIPGFVALGDTLHEVRGLVREGVPFYLEDDEVEIEEVQQNGQVVVEVRMFSEAHAWPAGRTMSVTSAPALVA